MTSFLKAMVSSAIVLLWTANSVHAACPSGWSAVDGRCFTTVFTNPNQCDALCITNGGRWATIGSQAQNDWFVARGIAVNNNIWIGLNDHAVEGTYQWTNPGDSFTYSNWMPGQPANDATKQCAFMYRFSQPIGSWYWISSICDAGKIYCGCVRDDPATSKRPTAQPTALTAPPTINPSIAITTPPSFKPSAAPTATLVCPAGWVNTLGKCYLTTNPKKDYSTCLSHCAGFGATLPCVMNTAENNYIAALYPNTETTDDVTVYLGLNDLVTEGTFQWQAGCSSTMSNFSPGEPNDAHGGEDCTAVYTNGLTIWNDLRCSAVAYCVCEKAPSAAVPSAAPSTLPPTAVPTTTAVPTANPTTATPTATPTTDKPTAVPTSTAVPTATPSTAVPSALPTTAPACPAGWESNFGKCYLTTNPLKSYSNCLSHCAGFGATLPCVMNAAENTYISNLFTTGGYVAVYLGLNDLVTEGTFQWQAGCSSTYTNWEVGEPNNHMGVEDCTMVYTNGKTGWNDLLCNDVVYCVCEKGMSSSRRLRGV